MNTSERHGVEGSTFIPFADLRSSQGADSLEDYVDTLEILHHTITARYASLRAMCEAYLEAGCRIFKMETGIVSHVEGDRYTVVAVRTHLDDLTEGAVFPLEDTYCREVVKAQQTLAFPHVGRSRALCGHPVYVNLKLEAYISAPIYVRGAMYGTVNFTSASPREHGFTDAERNVIDLMAVGAGNFVEQLEAEQQLKAKSEELAQANARLREFVGIVAHDLRNPVGTMEGFARYLLREDGLSERGRKFAERLVHMAGQSRQLVHDLLHISALQLGALSVNLGPTDVDEVAEGAAGAVEAQSMEKEVSVRLDIEAPSVRADGARLQQVLQNLVGNAVKFTPAGGQVVVRARSVLGGEVEIVVEDNGVGMSAAAAAELEAGTARPGGVGTAGEQGAGYGLRLVREVLKAHGARLSIDSVVGEGTSVSFRLPAA